MKLTIIPSDKTIGIDGKFYLDIQEDFSWVPADVHAVQWYETWGEVEFIDKNVPNERIEELGIYEQAIEIYDNETKKIQDELDSIEAARDYWKELRILRNLRLSESDWTQIIDVQLSDEQKLSWQSYRQTLRDLPENIIDPKPLVNDANHLDWPVKPT
jgi:hypothetical protein